MRTITLISSLFDGNAKEIHEVDWRIFSSPHDAMSLDPLMPYGIAIVLYFSRNGSFGRFRHFGWGLWTLSSLRKMTQIFFCNFRQNCCFRHFS